MGEDKRLYSRVDHVCPAQCSFLESFPESFPIGIVDISPEGFGFLCEQKLRAGAKLVIVVHLGTGEPVKFLAKVRWVRPAPNSRKHSIGVKIFDTSAEDLDKFIRFYYHGLIPGREQRKKVLIIKKDRERAGNLLSGLAKSGYDVICAFDGNDGFNKYVHEHPDLILLDMAIPKMSALEICRTIRKLQGDQKVIIFAMLAKEKDKTKAELLDIGIQKYYLASLSDDRLIAVVDDALSAGEGA